MTYLLDTHFVIWAVSETQKLSEKVRQILANPDNTIILSTVSFWEISLKQSIGKLHLEGGTAGDLLLSSIEMGFEILPLSADDASTFHHLTGNYHKDPFDRMLIWQAIKNDYTLISDDAQVKKYASEGLKLIW